jgi:hypothetical protein
VGKTIVGKTFGSLFEPHYLSVSLPEHITGRFNSSHASLLLLHAEVAFWAGDHAAEGKLKDLVTGSHHLIEYKGKDPVRLPNLTRLLVTGNAKWLVPAALDERRFCVLDVEPHHRQDTKYFGAIEADLDAGGREKLLDYLLTFDLSGVDLRQIPSTAALVAQKVSSLDSETAWWLDILMRGVLPGDAEGVGEAPCASIYANYIEHAKARGVNRRSLETVLGQALKRFVPKVERVRRMVDGVRTYVYKFPELTACRETFSTVLSGAEWPPPIPEQGEVESKPAWERDPSAVAERKEGHR